MRCCPPDILALVCTSIALHMLYLHDERAHYIVCLHRCDKSTAYHKLRLSFRVEDKMLEAYARQRSDKPFTVHFSSNYMYIEGINELDTLKRTYNQRSKSGRQSVTYAHI